MNTNKKNAVITFDYEVFLGSKTGSVENCVIKPTRDILDILAENNGKAIFFVDVTWLLFLRDNSESEFNLVVSQLKEIANSDSSVELHLHPQWLTAYKSNDNIIFNSDRDYKLHSLSKEGINDLFKKSVDLLQDITGKKIRCFRAGGFCIEPFSKIRDAFKLTNINFDFSVVPGVYVNEGKIYDFNYSEVPDLSHYKFEHSVITPEKKGSFTEIPLSVFRNNPVFRILNKSVLYLKNDKIYGDGMGMQVKRIFSIKTLAGWMKFNKSMLNLDFTWSLLFKSIVKIYHGKSDFLVVISHPKTASPETLKNIKHILKEYNTLNSDDLASFFSKEDLR